MSAIIGRRCNSGGIFAPTDGIEMNLDQKLQLALNAHTQGRVPEAEALYREVLKVRPRDVLALHHIGIIHYHRHEFDDAVKSIQKAIAIKKIYPEAYSNLGNVLRDQGKLKEAIAAYKEAIRQKPAYAEASSNLGSAYLALSEFDAALAAFDKAIKLKPDYAEGHFNRGVALRAKGQLEDAAAAFRQALALRPNLREAHFSLGVTLADMRRFEDAIASFEAAIALAPDLAEPYSNLGSAYMELDRMEEAAEACRNAVRLRPDFALAYYNLGVAVKRLGHLDEAIAAFRNAIAVVPNFAEAECNLGVALMDQGKMQEALDAFQRAVEIRPNFPEVYNNMGLPLRTLERLDEAAEAYRKAVALRPDYADAAVNLGNILRELGKQKEAIEAYKQGLATDPNNAKAHIQLIHLRRHVCDWQEFDADTKRLFELVDEVEPFVFLSAPSTAAQQLACSRKWASKLARKAPFVHSPDRHRGDRIRIGYLSADFRRHATAFLMAELFERHDRSRFETFAYSYGYDDHSDVRQRLIDAFDHFVDLQHTPYDAAADRIYADNIDILIDLKGYTGGVRTEILVNRPAPIQVNYLGYPGTMGADFIDYIIADRVVAPSEHAAFFSEKIVHLPHCYQPNDTKRAIAPRVPTRTECGLPESGVVFCSFNGSYKIAPRFFDIWMRLLREVPGSVLWLLASNDFVEGNLRREAVARGVAPERLVFGPTMHLPDHLARHQNADFFLDTLPINAHTTASDALWAGLPVLTCLGETFAGRVAASLVEAVGLPEMIVSSLEDYEALALQLARSPERVAELKAKLARNRMKAPLFDIDRFTQGIESAYFQMAEIYRAGQPPRAFAVEEDRVAAG
jgi:predicted O-linked N-acetylglucosamine transferase (SPINDLY family)